MISHKHLYVTYDNDRRYLSCRGNYSNYFASCEAKVKEKDNRLLAIGTVIF